MAGRKPPSEPNFFSTLLGKLGLERTPPTSAKKAGGGKRRRKRRPDEAGAAGGYAPEGEEGASPFADYDAHGGLMDQPLESEFHDTLSYEAAAAAGYAPPTASLPKFGGPPEPTGFSGLDLPATPPAPAPPAAPRIEGPPADGGRLFSVDALDNSLDALFSGLETGMVPPPLPPITPTPMAPMATSPAHPTAGTPAHPTVPSPHSGEGGAEPRPGVPKPGEAPGEAAAAEAPLFDEFGLTPPMPMADEAAAPPSTEPHAAHRPIHKPIVSEPSAPPPQAPTPIARPNTPLREVERAPSEVVRPATGEIGFRLPAPAILALADGVNLNGLLAAIDRTSGVAGSLIVGYDGLIIASSLPTEIDPDYLGAQATNLFMGNRGQLEKMRRGELRRIILETATGAMLVTAADMGILVVVSHEGRAMDIGGVMAAIGGALAQA